ncbi:hypothetical protein CBL_13319 [Carabus blaptoides fortunei]
MRLFHIFLVVVYSYFAFVFANTIVAQITEENLYALWKFPYAELNRPVLMYSIYALVLITLLELWMPTGFAGYL